ncbi:hypothetical protein FQN49_006809 [Arthroderma sp. PD_2]|nr:hypothetical protein FQN49_006809 [Arthroderma sp. PD_2]
MRIEKPGTLSWGPKKSKAVTSRQIGGEVGASLGMTPVEPSNPVLKHRIGDESVALQWMKDNTSQILQQYRPIVEKYGIWLVSKTYTSRRCAVAIMSSKSSAVEIGVGVDVPGLVTLTPSSTWQSSYGDLATEIHNDDQGVVAFVSGVYFSKTPLRSQLRSLSGQENQRNKIFRGGYVESDDDDELDENEFEITVI